jgi:ferredoxin
VAAWRSVGCRCEMSNPELNLSGVRLFEGRTFVHPELCAYCGLCEELCPEGAIALSYEIGGPDER